VTLTKHDSDAQQNVDSEQN